MLLDVQMPMAGGVKVIGETRQWSPETQIAVLSGVSAPGLVSALVESGVDCLSSKGDGNTLRHDKLPRIPRGQRFIAPRFVVELKGREESSERTGRERQVLSMIVAGSSNKEIAAGLGISIKTVDKHRTSMMQKLGGHSVPQLTAHALRAGQIDAAGEL